MLKGWLTRIIDQQVQRSYVEACVAFADAVDTTHNGRNPDWSRTLNNWQQREADYAARGFRTVPLSEFIKGFWTDHEPRGLGLKRAVGEAPIFYAALYRQEFGDQQHIVPTEMMTVVDSPTT